MFIWGIAIFTALSVILVFARLYFFTKTDERERICEMVRWFAGEAEKPENGSGLKYTGPYKIDTALLGICFTINSADNSLRLSVNLNANCSKQWWVLYEEFKKDEASGQEIRTERHETEFDAKSEAAAWLNALHKMAANALGKVHAPKTCEVTVDPFEPLLDEPKSARNS